MSLNFMQSNQIYCLGQIKITFTHPKS